MRIDFRCERLERRGEDGYVLASVLGMMLLFTLLAVAMLALVFSGLRMTRASISYGDRLRSTDGALETVLQQVRSEANSCLTAVADQDGISAECISETSYSEDGVDLRVVDLQAHRVPEDPNATPSLAGKARVRVVDIVVSEGDPAVPESREVRSGITVEVCDWRLGAAQAAGNLRGCE